MNIHTHSVFIYDEGSVVLSIYNSEAESKILSHFLLQLFGKENRIDNIKGSIVVLG